MTTKTKTLNIGAIRERTGYSKVLVDAGEDFFRTILGDDDLEGAVVALLDYARENGYNLQGENRTILAALRARA